MTITHLLITGVVQGVGFRKFVRHHGRKLGLSGWVRNLPEGSVEAEVVGEDELIRQLIEQCKKGPYLAKVTSVVINSIEKDFPYNEFILRHDLE